MTTTTDTAALIAELRTAGHTVRDIAAAVGVHVSTVYRWARNLFRPIPARTAALLGLTTRNTNPQTEGKPMTMLDIKGPEYIDKWLTSTCMRSDLALYELIPVIERITGATIPMPTNTLHPDREALHATVGGMEPATAKQVVAEAKTEGLRRYPHGRCYTCGLALNSRRRCNECS